MPKFRRKPAEVEAVRWDGSADTANRFLGERYGTDWEYCALNEGEILVPHESAGMSGGMYGKIGDWLVKANGRAWVVEAAAFAALYEPSEVV